MDSFRKVLFLALVISLLIPVSAMNGMAADKVVKFGVVGPFTGPASRSGAEFRAAAKMAFEKIGNKIGDYQIELVWIDTQSDPGKATTAYSAAVTRNKIQGSFSSWHSSVAVALMDQTAKYKVPHFFGPGGSSSMINKKYHSDPKYAGYWLKGVPKTSQFVEVYVPCLNNAIKKGLWKPDKKLVAIYGEETDRGRSAGEAFKKDFTATGWEIFSEDYFSITQTEFHPLMSKYKEAGVSVIAGTISGTASISSFIKTADEVGLKAVIVADGLGWVGEWYKLTGSASNYVLDITPGLVTPQARAWAKEMKEKYDIEASAWAAVCYDWDNFFIKIARRAFDKYGKIDKETLHKVALEEVIPGKLTYATKDGALIMDKYGFNSKTTPDPVFGPGHWYVPVVQYKNGKGRVVFPESWKAADFEAPK
jgi:branched-chain amino acid transport system substrate-binding protein